MFGRLTGCVVVMWCLTVVAAVEAEVQIEFRWCGLGFAVRASESRVTFNPSELWKHHFSLSLYVHIVLQQIPIVRALISQLGLLPLCKPNICRLIIPLLVLRPTAQTIDDTCDDGHDGEGDADAVAWNVLWSVFLEKSKDSNDASDIAEPHLPRRSDGASVMPAEC